MRNDLGGRGEPENPAYAMGMQPAPRGDRLARRIDIRRKNSLSFPNNKNVFRLTKN
jgi:hypothetical protein